MKDFISKPETKENLVIRVKPSTVRLLESHGAKSTVANKILEIALYSWDEFIKLDSEA